MGKQGKKIFVSVFLLLCMLLSSTSSFAADERLGEVIDGSLLTEDLESENTVHSVLRGTFLSYGSGGITNDGNKKISISGRTVCYRNCDKVKVTLRLQKLEGDYWATIATLGPKTATNTYTVSTSNSYKVTGGYYYRVRGSHTAIDDGNSEATVSVTNGIWISK